MRLFDREGEPGAIPAQVGIGIRPRPPRRFVSEFEREIRRLYVRMIDEPIPPRLIGVLRAGLVGHKP